MVADLDKHLEEEEQRIRALRRTLDMALALVRQVVATREQAEELAGNVRTVAVQLFPDKGGVFDLVCAPRLRRAIEERFPV